MIISYKEAIVVSHTIYRYAPCVSIVIVSHITKLTLHHWTYTYSPLEGS